MARAIKRAGVIFLALAIICLLAIGVLIGASSAKNEGNNSLDLSDEMEDTTIGTMVDNSFVLSGSNSKMAKTWNEACELYNETKQTVYVKLEQDWIANADERHTFGTGVGFYNGAICIDHTSIILDLNGHKIDRKLTKDTAISDGYVFRVVSGTFNIVDKTNSGVITGGANTSARAGGILANSSKISIYGGIISGNYASNDGAGICVSSGSRVNMYGGSITNNTAIYAGGIMVYGSTFNMYGGSIYNNTISSAGGAAYIYNNSTMNLYSGLLYDNTAGVGGAIRCYNYSSLNMYGGEIFNNSAMQGGAIDLLANSTLTLVGGKIYNNKRTDNETNNKGNISISHSTEYPDPNKIYIGKNAHVFNNTNSSGKEENIYLAKNDKIYITDKLLSANVGVTLSSDYGTNTFTQGYASSGNTLNPDKFFTADQGGLVASTSGNEVILKSGTKPTTKVTWSWTGAGTGNANVGYYSVPYTGSAYNIKSSVGTFFDDKGNSINSFSATDAGVYAFYTNGNYLNTTFTFVIEPMEVELEWSNTSIVYNGNNNAPTAMATGVNGLKLTAIVGNKQTNVGTYYAAAGSLDNANYKIKSTTDVFCKFSITPKPIDKPTVDNSRLIYNGKELTYIPKEFNSDQMIITDNVKTEIGDYTAKVKPNSNHMWKDGTSTLLDFPFKIIAPGVVAKDSSNYDYIYKQTSNNDNYRKTYGNDYKHKINDNTLNIVDGKPRYVLGNIKFGTNITTFLNNLQSESKYIKIYQSESDTTPIFDGIANNGVIASEIGNLIVTTGYKVVLYRDTTDIEPLDIIYLSVLGDVVPDGMINTMDVTFINRIATGEVKLEDLSIEQQLAAMVDNKGKVTTTDGKILLKVIGGNTEINSYFDSIASDKNTYEMWSISIDTRHGKIYRTSREITTSILYNNRVIGNIAPQTSANVFKAKLATQLGVDTSAIAVYKANGAVAKDNDYIGTGCYINYNGNTDNKIYLSVLGDLTGDGIVNTLDVTCLNRIVSGNIRIDSSDELLLLTAIIQNKGNLDTADSETLLNYIGGNVDLTKYF